MLVRGPIGTSHTSSLFRMVSMRKRTASELADERVTAGRTGPSSPVFHEPLQHGEPQPAEVFRPPQCISTLSPTNSANRRALSVVRSRGAFPDTVVIPRTSVKSAAIIIAMASSCPGSQSIITLGLIDASFPVRSRLLHPIMGET